MKKRKAPAKSERKRREGESRTRHPNEAVLSGMVPGQELERAAADVGREAGKSLLRGLERLFGARFAGWLAENEAKAKAARMAIDTTASIERARAITTERRRQELEEIRHQEEMALAQRRLNRLLTEMAREQANFEAIAAHSLKQIEHDPAGDKSREIEDDWLFKFARYAQDVSDREMQELWARILASAAIEGRQRVSAAALQAMSLLDNKSAGDFEKFIRVHVTFGSYPLVLRSYEDEPQDINLRTLRELGLIDHGAALNQYSFPEFDLRLGEQPGDMRLRDGAIFDVLHTVMGFTQRGAEIADAVFPQQTDMRLGDELEEKYLKTIISSLLEKHAAVNIFPKVNGKQVAYVIQIKKRTGRPLPGTKTESSERENEELSGQLRLLITWADENNVISRAPNPYYQNLANESAQT